jgi:outer membrane receptor protein involved in Fe transport
VRTFQLTISTLALAVAAGWTQQAIAQESPTPQPPAAATQEITELPGLVVEAPAKRNVKKEKLRRSAPQTAGQPVLEQQVIEGEKITRTIRDTTTSVGVVTGKDIEERQIRDLDGAIEQTANVITSEDPNTGFVIRGLNSEGQTGLQHISAVPLIGVVVDGVTQNPDTVRRGARGLWDVEQVEVLRGPQSTLQGRNALGGTVVVKTNDPTYKLGSVVEGTIGTNDLYGAGFVLNAPIVAGQSAFRISGYKTEQDRGISYSDPYNEQLGIDAYDTLRGKLLIEPDSLPGFSALFTIARTNDEPGSAQVSGPNFGRRLDATSDFTDFREGSANNYAADISYEFMPGLTIRSVTAFADTENTIKTAPGAAFSRFGDNTDSTDFTQDLRLEIDNSGNGISGVVGLSYGQLKRDNFGHSTANLDYFYAGYGFPNSPVLFGYGTYGSETTNLAAYADLRYRWNRWSFNAGGRLLRDTIETSEDTNNLDTSDLALFQFLMTGVPVYDPYKATTKATFEEFLPKLGVTYDLTSNQTVGATYNKGYRTGYEQVIRAFGVTLVSTVDPEFVDTYEVSYRSTWLGKTLDFNANVFYNDYTDQQVAVLTSNHAVQAIYNAASSHSYGAEFEARWRPTPPLQIFGSIGLLKTKFDEIIIGSPAANHSGNEYPEAPAFTFSAGAMYHSPTGWFAGANVRHVDGYYSSGNIANAATGNIDAYTIVDAQVGWEWENYTLTLFAKNLFDEEYLTSVNTNDRGRISPAYGFIGDERQIGLTLRAEF